jgi:hypothetical protein
LNVVVASLSFGAVAGVLLSAGFVWVEVGRFATPQVPETLFDERREIFAYTAGLFVGVPLAVAYVFYQFSMGNGALPGALLFLGLLVGGTEVAQWALLRSRYWGGDESGPFYALGFRAAIGGIIGLAIISQYLGGSPVTVDGVALIVLDAVALVALEVTGALLSIRPKPGSVRTRGGALSGALFAALGFFLLGIGPIGGEESAFVGAGLVLLVSLFLYRNLRAMLTTIPAPSAGPPAPAALRSAAYGRTRGDKR